MKLLASSSSNCVSQETFEFVFEMVSLPTEILLFALMLLFGIIKLVGGGGKLGLLEGAAVGSLNDGTKVFIAFTSKGKATRLFKKFLFGDFVCSIDSLYENLGGSFHPASIGAERENSSISIKYVHEIYKIISVKTK